VSVVVAILLAAGTVAALVGCWGVLLAGDVFRRLHWMGMATALPALCLIAAVLVRQGWGAAGVKALLVLALIEVSGPVLNHAIARAAWIRPRGEWRAPGE
jgi:monovalent cation/proton antiporter MnhG/PhaG subunit